MCNRLFDPRGAVVLFLPACISIILGASAYAAPVRLSGEGLDEPNLPLAESFTDNLDDLERNPAAMRDSQGRLLFDSHGQLLLKSATNEVPPSKGDAFERVIVRLRAEQSSRPYASTSRGSTVTQIERIFQAQGEDWRRAEGLKAPLLPQRSQRGQAAFSGAVASSLQEAYRRTFVVPVTDSAKVAGLVRDLSALPGIEFAQPSYRYRADVQPDSRPFDTGQLSKATSAELKPWGIDAIDARRAGNISKGKGVVVAVVDTGINRLHTQLRDRVWRNNGEVPNNCIDDDNNGFIDDVVGWSFADQAEYSVNSTPPSLAVKDCGDTKVFNETMDLHYHGSHVAGTIAASTPTNDGQNLSIVGVAPEATVMAVKGLRDDGSGYTEGLAAGIVYAAANGAHVINNSWGRSPHLNQLAIDALLEEAVRFALDQGALVIFAAGNNLVNADRTANFGVSPTVLSVGAVRTSDLVWDLSNEFDRPSKLYSVTGGIGRLFLAGFSNFGHAVDLTAPGVSILSTFALRCSPQAFYAGNCKETESKNYGYASGTSMAAPHVAGVAALVRAINPSLTPPEVRSILVSTAFKSRRGSAPDPFYGAGVVNALEAAKAAVRSINRSTEVPLLAVATSQLSSNLSKNEDLRLTATIGNARRFSATLFDYDRTFSMSPTVSGRELLRLQYPSPSSSNTFDLRLPLKALKSGRYLLMLSVSSVSGLTREFVPFAVEENQMLTLANLTLNERASCLRARGDWMMWYETSWDSLPDLHYTLKVANVRTGESRAVSSYIDSRWRAAGDPLRISRDSSCPVLLDDESAAWVTTDVDATYFERVVSGQRPEDTELLIASRLMRMDLASGVVTSQALPYLGVPKPSVRQELSGAQEVGISTNGKDIVLMGEKRHFAQQADGTFAYQFTSTGLHLIKASSMSPTPLFEEPSQWSPSFLVGPLPDGKVTLGGYRASLGTTSIVSISTRDSKLSIPRWATPSFLTMLYPDYEMEVGPASGSLMPMVNNIPLRYMPKGMIPFIRPGLSVFDAVCGRITRIGEWPLGYFAINASGLAWVEEPANPEVLLRIPSIERLDLSTRRRASVRSVGFRGVVGRVASTPYGLAAVVADAQADPYTISRYVRVYGISR